jgi:acyl-CoA thioesterase
MVVRPYFTEQKQVLSFDKVIELEKIDDYTFRSIVKAYSPTGTKPPTEVHLEILLITAFYILGGENGTYGGHVFAQAAWAAAQTVGAGYLIHVS